MGGGRGGRNVKVRMTAVWCGAVLGVLFIAGPARAQAIDPRIEKLVASVSEGRLQQLLQKLSSFKTRNTCSDPAAPDTVGAARQWIFDELKRTSPKLQVSFDTHQVQNIRGCQGTIELRNVMAVLPGKSPRRIYVSGHYDTVNLGAGGQQTSNSGAGRGAQPQPQPPAAAAGRGAQPQTRPGAEPQAPGEPPAANQPRPVRDPNIVAPGAD